MYKHFNLKDIRDYSYDFNNFGCFRNKNEIGRCVFRFIWFWSTEPFGSPQWKCCLKSSWRWKIQNFNSYHIRDYSCDFNNLGCFRNRNEIGRYVFRLIRFWSTEPFGSPHSRWKSFIQFLDSLLHLVPRLVAAMHPEPIVRSIYRKATPTHFEHELELLERFQSLWERYNS